MKYKAIFISFPQYTILLILQPMHFLIIYIDLYPKTKIDASIYLNNENLWIRIFWSKRSYYTFEKRTLDRWKKRMTAHLLKELSFFVNWIYALYSLFSDI